MRVFFILNLKIRDNLEFPNKYIIKKSYFIYPIYIIIFQKTKVQDDIIEFPSLKSFVPTSLFIITWNDVEFYVS